MIALDVADLLGPRTFDKLPPRTVLVDDCTLSFMVSAPTFESLPEIFYSRVLFNLEDIRVQDRLWTAAMCRADTQAV